MNNNEERYERFKIRKIYFTEFLNNFIPKLITEKGEILPLTPKIKYDLDKMAEKVKLEGDRIDYEITKNKVKFRVVDMLIHSSMDFNYKVTPLLENETTMFSCYYFKDANDEVKRIITNIQSRAGAWEIVYKKDKSLRYSSKNLEYLSYNLNGFIEKAIPNYHRPSFRGLTSWEILEKYLENEPEDDYFSFEKIGPQKYLLSFKKYPEEKFIIQRMEEE